MSELTGAQVVLGLLVLVLGPGGAAWVATKVSLNGARQDIREIKGTTGRMEGKVNATAETVARLEERTTNHEQRITRLEDAA